LNAIATPAAREPGPLVTRCRSGTVAKVDSIGGGGVQVHPVFAGSCRNSSNTSSCAVIFAAAYTATIDRRVGPPVPDVGPAHAYVSRTATDTQVIAADVARRTSKEDETRSMN